VCAANKNTPNSIKIEGNLSYELQTYIFLHELGHHQLRKDWNEFHKILKGLTLKDPDALLK
jgi:Zn-dependent peptidase ImmA (M78 family)